MNQGPIEPVPERLADFEVVHRLGAGGMAEVFLAKKRGAESTHKLLVVKRVHPQHHESQRFRSMFAEEAQLATRLNHPNIVQVYDFQDYGESGLLLSMEYVEGLDLRRLQRAARAAARRIPPYVAAYLIAEVAKGLHYAHNRRDESGGPLQIVHRDVSPQNILLSHEGSVKIADFGIATANIFREQPGTLKGKTGYMSPEQARGERVDLRSDIYSLGVVFHELLGNRPLHGAARDAELLAAVRSGRVEPPSTFAREVPPALEAIAMHALAADPAERYQNARDIATELTRSLFERQEVVDAHTLETVIAELAPREIAPDIREPANQAPRDSLRALAGREVRHVALASINVRGVAALEAAVGASRALHIAQQLRATFDEIAFKHQALLSWVGPEHPQRASEVLGSAQAVVGLTEHAARAPVEAARLALDALEAVAAVAEDLPTPLAVSVGLARAIATGRRDKSGHLVQHSLHESARRLAELLAEQAPSGAIWVAGGLYRLLRTDFVWGDAPDVYARGADAEAAGLPEQLRVYALERPYTRDEKLREQALSARELVGRDAELADLHAAYHQSVGSAGQGTGRVVARAVVGEIGIGKSALASAFVSELPPDARVLRVECSPAQAELPFANVAAWIRELTGIEVGQSIEEARAAIEAILGPHVTRGAGEEMTQRMARLASGRLLQAADEAEYRHNRQMIARGLQIFFARAASEGPLLVIVDGLQWSDRPSLELISKLVRRPDPLPILALLLTRPDERVDGYVEGLVRIELSALNRESQVRLLEARLGVHVGVEEAAQLMLPRTGGNPYFLIEMVDALLERGLLRLDDAEGELPSSLVVASDQQVAEAVLPSTLEQLIADRLNELDATERALIDWLAVAGGELSSEDLEVLAGEDASEAVARLCARGLCDRRKEGVGVRHPVTREVAYRGLDPAERRRLHRAVGERWHAADTFRGIRAALVAEHLARGGARELAADLYLEAARAARASHQMGATSRYFRRALNAMRLDDPRSLEAYEALEAIERLRGRWAQRRRYLAALRSAARKVSDPRWVSMAHVRTARFYQDAGRLQPALDSANRGERAAHHASDPTVELEAQCLTAEILRDLGDTQGALSASDRALNVSKAADAHIPLRLRAEVLRARGSLLRRIGRVHEAVDAHAEAIALAHRSGARRLEARSMNSLAFALFVLGRFEDAISLAVDAIRIEREIGGRIQIPRTLSNIGQCYARLGDLPRAIAYLKRACQAHERYGDQEARSDTWLCTAEVLLEAEQIDAARTLTERAEPHIEESGSAYDAVHVRILRALLARASGDPGAAVIHAYDARQTAEAHAYAAFHFYAMAVEAMARVDIGELHTGTLLATTALGALDALQGSEYGIETRAYCVSALRAAGSAQGDELQTRSRVYVERLLSWISDPKIGSLFLHRKPVITVLGQGGASTDREGAA